ncbi:hypothetical protein ACHAXN_008310 [Cyclotella atomus]
MKIKENTSNDESIARELQEQFRREVEQYASSSAWNEIHSVFTPDDEIFQDTVQDLDSIPVVDAIPDDGGSTTCTPPMKKKYQDLSFSTQSTTPPTSLDGSPLERMSGPVSIDELDGSSQEVWRKRQQKKDEELARRLEREMRDEALARELRASQEFIVPVVESDADLARRLARESEEEARGRRRWGLGADATRTQKVIYYGSRILSVVIVICASYLVFMMVWGQNVNPALDPSTWLPGWPEGDPSLGSVGENNIWDMNGNYRGLTLQVLNNLDEGSDWHQYFETAIADWNDGTPDAVNLYLRSSTYDPDCRAVRKAMKVCNGNYGPTDWRGVNQILLQDEFIITSLAKMNDYYLEGTNMAQKQYTMCHELGHGLGLGHTDENFYNRDLGNCMDYTERPQNNMHPDESNFEQLEILYGNVDGTSVRPDARLRSRRTESTPEEEHLLEDNFELYSSFLSEPVGCWEQMDAKDGWRLLRKSGATEQHERDLGNGYKIQKHILLAT